MEENIELVEELISKKNLDGVDKFLLEKYLAAIKKLLLSYKQLKNNYGHQSREIKEVVDYTFELNKELEKKDNIIDLMAEWISNYSCNDNFKDTPIQVKQYFERKVEDG